MLFVERVDMALGAWKTLIALGLGGRPERTLLMQAW